MMDPELIRIIEDNNLQLHGDIEYFAEMVAQREREACAQTIEELLEALEDALEDWEDTHFDEEYPSRIEWADKARAAIKKARGEA